MDAERHLIFAAEVRAQLREIAVVYDRIADREQVPGVAGRESVALQVHNLYNAIEGLLELVAAACENHLDPGGGYYRLLLKRMHTPVPGVRPAIVSDEALPLIDNLRRFRQIVWHAYNAEIDSRQLGIMLEDAKDLRPLLWRDVEGFLTQLAA